MSIRRAARLVVALLIVTALPSVLAGACSQVIQWPGVPVGQSFSLRVTDRDHPVGGLLVKLTYDDYTALSTPVAAITNAAGVARFDGVPPGFYLVFPEHDVGIGGGVSVQVSQNGPPTVTVPMNWPARTPIRVRTAIGTLHNLGSLPGSRRASVSLVEAVSAHLLQTADTDEMGHFSVLNVSPGLYFLSLSSLGTSIGEIAIEVSEDAEEERLDVDLRWSDCGLHYTDRSQPKAAQSAVK